MENPNTLPITLSSRISNGGGFSILANTNSVDVSQMSEGVLTTHAFIVKIKVTSILKNLYTLASYQLEEGS